MIVAPRISDEISMEHLGQLRNIKQLKPWDIFHVLTDKYKWPPYEAIEFAHFLEPMLHYDVNQRATAEECLMNPW